MKRERSYMERQLLLGRWNARVERRSFQLLGPEWEICARFAAGRASAFREALAGYRLEQVVKEISERAQAVCGVAK